MDGVVDVASEDLEARWLRTEFARRTTEAPAVSPEAFVLCELLCGRDLARTVKTIRVVDRAWKELCNQAEASPELRAKGNKAVSELYKRPDGQGSDFDLAECIDSVLGNLYGTLGWWFGSSHPYLLAAKNGNRQEFRAATQLFRPSQLVVGFALESCEVGANTAWLLEGVDPVRPHHLNALARKLDLTPDCTEVLRAKLMPREASRLLAELAGPSGRGLSATTMLFAPVLKGIG